MPILSSPKLSVSATASKQGNYNSALIALAVLYFMMGFITCLNDSLVPFFKAGFNLSYSQSSLVQFYFFLTYGIISIPAGKVVEKIGFKNGMVAGFAIAAVGALLFYPASVFHVYYLFLSALFILAIGIVLLQVSANPYITVLGRPETASSRLTLIQGVGSIGTTVAPLFGAAFILSSLKNSGASSVALRMPYLLIAACLVVIAIVVMQLKLPTIKPGDESISARQNPVKSIFSFRNLNFGIIAIFMYVGAEVSIGTFLTNYISDKVAIANDAANHYVAFYWGGMLVGRLFGSIVLRSVKPWIVLTTLSLLSVGLILVSISSEGYIAVWSMIAVGVCNSVMFAIIFSLSIVGLSTYTTQASGLLSTAIAGGAVVSLIQGLIKDHYSWQAAFIVPVVCYLYILFYGISGYKSKNSPYLQKK
jgi:MFS transporter, FHS family, L-fucose permease